MTRLLSLVRAQGTKIGAQHSPQREGTVTQKPKIESLEALLRMLASLDSVKQIIVTGLDPLSAIKLRSLARTGRDFTQPSREMELTIMRFLRALFARGLVSQAQIDATIEEAVIKVISLRLRSGGGDVKSSFRPLTAAYAARKRREHPNAKGIGWASGDLHDAVSEASVRIVRRR